MRFSMRFSSMRYSLSWQHLWLAMPEKTTAFWAVGFMLVSIIGKIITQYYSQLQRVHAGYFMAAGKRIQIGDKLKIVPMGYFNQNSLGNITAVATTILSDVETTAPVVLVTTLGGFINAVVFAVVILLFDWRIGLLVVACNDSVPMGDFPDGKTDTPQCPVASGRTGKISVCCSGNDSGHECCKSVQFEQR